MNMGKYKRDYKFRSDEGSEGGKNLIWLIIICGLAVAAAAYFIG